MSSVTAPPIQLDEQSITLDELSIPALTREISLKKRSTGLLYRMMNVLEKKRQGKGYGWSRSWNKYGVNVFRTHICEIEDDADYLNPIAPFLKKFLEDPPQPYADFIQDLIEDPTRMAFTFYHNSENDGRQYEGLTLSLGRKIPADKTKRDRLDIILEDLRVDGAVDGKVDRLRVYLCPWATYQDKHFHLQEVTELTDDQRDLAQELYDHCVRHYHDWKGEEERQWSHWSIQYIDYFGARNFIPQGSSFT